MSNQGEKPLQSDKTPDRPMRHKATQTNGDPGLKQAETSPSGLKPRDDTPGKLDKHSGPKNP